MSVEAALAFLKAADADEGLRQELALIKGRKAIEEVAALAARRGHHFSVEDYREAVVQLAEGQLSEEALDEVRRELGLQNPD